MSSCGAGVCNFCTLFAQVPRFGRDSLFMLNKVFGCARCKQWFRSFLALQFVLCTVVTRVTFTLSCFCWEVSLCFSASTTIRDGGRSPASVAILAQVGIQAPGLSFRCLCHLGNPIKTRFESGFCLLCTSHGTCCLFSSSVGNLVVPDRVRSLWWNMDTKLGGSKLRAEPVEDFPAAERHIGRFLPRQE